MERQASMRQSGWGPGLTVRCQHSAVWLAMNTPGLIFDIESQEWSTFSSFRRNDAIQADSVRSPLNKC
jgi:hypothetical protein